MFQGQLRKRRQEFHAQLLVTSKTAGETQVEVVEYGLMLNGKKKKKGGALLLNPSHFPILIGEILERLNSFLLNFSLVSKYLIQVKFSLLSFKQNLLARMIIFLSFPINV